MSHYHQLLNQLNELNLSCMKENLPAHLDEVAKSDKSLVDSLFELTQQEISYRKKRKSKKGIKACNVPLPQTTP